MDADIREDGAYAPSERQQADAAEEGALARRERWRELPRHAMCQLPDRQGNQKAAEDGECQEGALEGGVGEDRGGGKRHEPLEAARAGEADGGDHHQEHEEVEVDIFPEEPREVDEGGRNGQQESGDERAGPAQLAAQPDGQRDDADAEGRRENARGGVVDPGVAPRLRLLEEMLQPDDDGEHYAFGVELEWAVEQRVVGV